MLYIKTDIIQTEWLKYILSEFKRIQCFQSDIQISGLNEALPADARVIYYTEKPVGQVNIVNRSRVLPEGDILQVSLELYVIRATYCEDRLFYLPYDLFWNAFVFLSRLEEYVLAGRNKSVHSHCILHPRQDKATFAVPVVNILFEKLENLIRLEFPDLPFGDGNKPVIDLSHDVDYLSKSMPFMLKQTVLNLYDILGTLRRPRDCGKTIRKAAEFIFRRTSYWTFEYWEELEKRMDVRSIFYIHAKARRNPLTWLIDPNYDLARFTRLQDKLRQLVADGFTIGLHGSYFSAVDGALMRREKAILEEVIGKPVKRGRQHWLRYVENATPYIIDDVFEVDSTLGWNDRVGFRNGCASAFHPYDHRDRRPFKHIEIPQVIMDFNIYQSLAVENMEFVNRSIQVLDRAVKRKKAHIAISWHDRSCTADYNWHGTYEHIINEYIGPWKKKGRL